MNDADCKYFISWVQTQLSSYSPGFLLQDNPRRQRLFINPTPNAIWDMERLQPLINAVKRYTFTDTQKEYFDQSVFSRLLYPLGYRRGNSDAHVMLTQLNAITAKDNMYRLKAELETPFFLPHKEGYADGPLITARNNHELGRLVHSPRVFTVDDPSTTEVDDGISIETLQDGTEWVIAV
jgi:hypothetical protein